MGVYAIGFSYVIGWICQFHNMGVKGVIGKFFKFKVFDKMFPST